MTDVAPSPARGQKPAQGEPVIDRGLRLLAAFGPGHEALTLEQLSARADLPKATALRLARRLIDWGALERHEDGRFVIGLRLLEVATLSPRGHGIRSAALPAMGELHRLTGQHVLLAVPDGNEAVLVERLSSPRAGKVLFRVGGRLPLHATSVGLVLLAHAPHDVRQSVLAGDHRRPDGGRPLSEAELRGRLANVYREGVALASLDRPEPMSSVAVPITGRQRSVVAALAVVVPTGAISMAALKQPVIAAGRAVSRAL
ncbi:IclR family transcriptional regulator [Streptomyces malaysiensis]|uniref:IclR family transcriptional regulator n=1 Tax=Streptomyces malaysiensis TaxID=92644 RepID=UPI0037221DFA